MAKIKPERAYAKELFNGFSGIGPENAINGRGAADIQNFRILSDGSLEKRCGWKRLYRFSYKVKAFWSGSLNHTSYSFAVAGKQVYRIFNDDYVVVATLPSDTENVRFFSFRETLFLLSGTSILSYRASTDSFSEADGYAPLYGYNWHPTDMGDIHEPINLLSKHMRVHYFNTTGSATFYLPFYADSVDQVRINGAITTNHTLSENGRYVTAPDAASASSVEIAFTLASTAELRKNLVTCTNVFTDRNESRDILALYGAAEGNLLFCASPVTENMLHASEAIFPNTDALYFKQYGILTLGDSDHPLTTLFRNRDRVLAFHSDGAYSVCFAKDSDIVEAYPVLKGMGCDARNAEVYLDGDPVVLNTGGVFRLHSTVAEPDEFETTCLSDGMLMLRGADFTNGAIACEDPVHRELWFSNPAVESGRIWVYQIASGQWVSFANINPVFFFSYEGNVGFGYSSSLGVFDETLDTDAGAPIAALYRSPYLSFSYPESPKRSLRLSVCVEGLQFGLDVTAQSEDRTSVLSFKQGITSTPVLLETRVPLGRFRLLQVMLRDLGATRSRIHRLALFANL